MPYRDLRDDLCSIARPVSVLGDRWTLLVLRQAFRGIRRFGHFQSTLGISRPVLAERLGQLVSAGHPGAPPLRERAADPARVPADP